MSVCLLTAGRFSRPFPRLLIVLFTFYIFDPSFALNVITVLKSGIPNCGMLWCWMEWEGKEGNELGRERLGKYGNFRQWISLLKIFQAMFQDNTESIYHAENFTINIYFFVFILRMPKSGFDPVISSPGNKELTTLPRRF